MPNFKRIGGGPWKSPDDLTWNDPLVIRWYFVKDVASYHVQAKNGVDELLVIKINDVEFRDSRDTPRKQVFRFSHIHVIS